jgi:Skp family chaperone for outer membrane proteins
MKKFLLIFLIAPFFAFAATPENAATKDDIKIILEQMDKRFEQVDRRFEQIDKRFEQIDKRLDFMQNLIYALMGLIFASPFIAIYLRDKKESEERKNFDTLKATLFVLREMAQDDEKMAKRMKAAGIL